MCSGALLLAPEKDLPLKKLYTKNIPRILVSMLVWSMGYKCFHLLVNQQFTPTQLLQSLKEVLLFDQEFHFYYLHIILLVYCLLPITRILTQHGTKAQLQYALAFWFVFGILYPTVRPFWPFSLLRGIPGQWLLNMTYAAAGYGLLGYYLKQYPLRRRWVYTLLLAAGYLFVLGGTWLLSIQQGELYRNFFEGMSFGVALMSAGVYGLCTGHQRRAGREARPLVTYISQASFCVYLLHVLVIYICNALGLTVHLLPCLVSIPLLALLNLFCCCGAYALLRRIPLVKTWLV